MGCRVGSEKTEAVSKKSKEISKSKPDSRQTPKEYWDEYYSEVGNKGDNIDDLKRSLEKRNVNIKEGSQASYKDNTITHANDTKRWEVKEEFLHSKVEKDGWKKDKIKSLRKQLRKRRVKQPARVAEEITVKEYMLKKLKLFGLNEADVKLLQKQVKQLTIHGLDHGY